MKRLFAISLTLVVIMTSVWYFHSIWANNPEGQIVIRIKSQDGPQASDMLIMDGDGNSIRWVGKYHGSPAWSPDGHFLAVGCKNEICILDMATLPDRRNHLGNQSRLPKVAYRLPASKPCFSNYAYEAGMAYSGILSMSWSPAGNKLAVVCGEERVESLRIVCILSLDGESNCWKDEMGKNVYRVAWSPVDPDVIAVGGAGIGGTSTQIFLVNEKGENPTVLTYGWSPEWSPNGTRIAFISDEPGHLGIATIKPDGTDRQWLYLSSSRPPGEMIYFDCRGLSGTCRLSWSPDGRYMTFVSSNGDIYDYRQYRLDTKTGNVIRLVDSMLFEIVAEPDWGSQ